MSTATIERARPLSTGDLARLTGAPYWRLRKILDRGDVPTYRVGRYRCVDVDQLPAVIAALEAAGYPPKAEDGA